MTAGAAAQRSHWRFMIRFTFPRLQNQNHMDLGTEEECRLPFLARPPAKYGRIPIVQTAMRLMGP